MGFTEFVHRRLAVLAAMGIVLAVAGCQSGDTLGALKLPGTGGGQEQAPPADDGRITTQELLAFCPQVSIRESESIQRTYARGGQDNPDKLIYQAAITESTRSCTYQNGMLGMTVALAGRVVPGPVSSTGTITLPLRVRVVQGSDVIFDQTFRQDVVIADTVGATQFVFTDSSFSMPQPTQTNIRVFASFPEAVPRR